MKKCKLTMTGKHIFKEVEERTRYYVADHLLWGEKIYIKKCSACGMIDDRKVKKEK